MKKQILLLPAILLVFQLVKAQKPDAAVAIVRYAFSHVRDTTNKANVYTENMELVLGKNASVYRSKDQRMQHEQMKKEVLEHVNNGQTTGVMHLTPVNKTHISNIAYYQFQAEKKLIRQEINMNYYLVEEPWPVLNWKITTDTASFSSLHCQKATTTFKGRNYEAWFCPALPFRSGPWKLNGLPGLIIEASDSKKEVIFKFAGLDNAAKIASLNTGVKQMDGFDNKNSSIETVALPQKGIKTTEKELDRLKGVMKNDPKGFANTALAGEGSNARVTSITTSKTINSRKNTYNNPIELPEK